MFSEDLTLFYDEKGFAVQALWSGSATPILVDFHNPTTEVLGVTASNPYFTVIASVVPNIARGQTVVINSVNYRIEDVSIPELGELTVQLKKT